MGFDKKAAAKKYVAKDGDTLRKIAERETAAGNPVTWQEIAKYNWGTDDEAVINEYLRDELGCRKRDESNNFVISGDDEPQGELLIPVRFKKSGLAVEKVHTLRVKKKVSPPQFLECCSIPGVTFEFDKSFVRPSVVDHLQALQDALEKHPDAQVMVFGHTDKVGPELYNKKLSERRARSVYAFIINDENEWEKLYKEEDWGIRVVQEILKDFGGDFDPGPVDGVNGPKTKKAVRNYQEARGLMPNGVADSATRKRMFKEYMTGKHDIELGPDRFMDPKHMGCGEFNPVKETEQAHEPNRRVMFYLFHKERPPKLPCQHGNLAPCTKQKTPPEPRHTPTFKCSFYDSLSRKCGAEVGPPVAPAKELELTFVDDHFAPSKESLDIKYRIKGLSGDAVTITIRSARHGADALYERELTADEKTDGEHTIQWDGKTAVAGGPLAGKYVNPRYTPYEVTLSSPPVAATPAHAFKVLVHSLELKLGDFEKGIFDHALSTTGGQQERLRHLGYYHGAVGAAAGDAKFKKAVEWFQDEHVPAAPAKGVVDPATQTALGQRVSHCVEGGVLSESDEKKIFVSGAFLYSNVNHLSPGGNHRFNAERTFWGDGLKIPVYVKIFLKNKADAKVEAPEAIGNTQVLFEWIDVADNAALVGKQRDYVTKARDYHSATTKPSGDNCHKDRGGKRGDDIRKVFPENADTAVFPFVVTRGSARTWAVLSTAREEADEWRGWAGVIFRPSRMGGDRYRVHAYLHTEKDLDTGGEKNTPPDVEVKTATMTVWRKVRVNQYLHKPHATVNAISMATVNQEVAKAYMEFTGNLAKVDVTQATWNATVTAALTSDPDFATIGAVNYASLNTIDFKSHAAYTAGGGALGAAAYNNLCRSKVRPWIDRVIREFAKNTCHGMTVLRVGNAHAGYMTNSGLAPGDGNVYVWWPKASYDNMGYVVEKYALHEMGHALYLRHHFTAPAAGPVATWPASDNPNDHDADDAACALSYYQTAWHLCGQCVLKLRGWDEAQLSKDDDDNKKP